MGHYRVTMGYFSKKDMTMAKKKKLSFSEVLKNIRNLSGDFVPGDYLKELTAEFKKPSPSCCNWCLVDYIYSVHTPALFPFFADLISSYRDWYELETAIDWLLWHNTEESRGLLRDKLPDYLGHAEKDIRDAAIRGLRNLNTNEVLGFLWEARTRITFSSEEETTSFVNTVDAFLRQSPHARVFHIIP